MHTYIHMILLSTYTRAIFLTKTSQYAPQLLFYIHNINGTSSLYHTTDSLIDALAIAGYSMYRYCGLHCISVAKLGPLGHRGEICSAVILEIAMRP